MDKIFKYPAVQYIPLRLYKSRKGNNSFNLSTPRIEIKDDYTNHKTYNLFFLRLSFKNNREGFLKIRIYNGEIDFIKYRGHEVFMVGKPATGKYHFFQVTKKYFYKRRLIFTFYNKDTGEKLDRESYVLK